MERERERERRVNSIPAGRGIVRHTAPPAPHFLSLTPFHLSRSPLPLPHCSGPSEVLNGWSGNIGRLLNLVEKTCQQIQKESMVHGVPIGTQA